MIAGIARTRAAILVRQHEPLALDEIDLPDRLERGQVLVRVHVAGVCGSQLGEIDGAKGPDRFLPHLLGHEGCATVLATGREVASLREGDRVVMHWRPGAGLEAAPARYRRGAETVNAGWVTTFNEYAVVSENRLTTVPADFETELASLLGCPVTTGLGVVANDARLAAGESIIVLGAGGVGLAVLQGAVLAGAGVVVVVDRTAAKLALAARLGADRTVDASGLAGATLEQELRALVGSDGADVVVENTGVKSLIELAYRLSKPKGRTVLVGVPRASESASIDTLPLHFGKVLRGSHGGSARPEIDVPHCIELYRSGRLRLDEMVTDRFPFSRVNEAIAALREGRIAGRCLLEMGASSEVAR
jgi:S-(hydroxymethyl)glutathione dehydrogenase/alcohol dehydrogenase